MPNLVVYKRTYREVLDALALSPAERDALIAEVRHAYELNSALFDGLARS